MGRTVLIADDSKLNILMITDILKSEGYEVYSVTSGLEVMDAIKKYKPDIVLLDVVMPGKDGFTVCSEIKCNYQFKNLPVIMVTARTEAKYLKTALEIGAFDYIRKPVDAIEVIARIKSALRYKEHQEKLEEMAMKDGLTGLYNHALLIELLAKEHSKQKRLRGSLAFLMIDIDYFKKVNDTYGHLKGNEVIKGVANIMMTTIREGDIAGRYGGEEFGIVLSNITLDKVIAVSERIRRRIALQSFSLEGQTVNITVSIGACYKSPDNDISHMDMIKIADEAMYEAKRSGRNNVKVRTSLAKEEDETSSDKKQ
ncbi:MAG: diguanylate cyclase [Clostridiales bacterium]|nr:diguanylate cyclase [Clostridiales bacterium]